ncbi:cell division protein FtsQ/DivIB [Brachybacterium sp. DNPG3]
MVRSISAKRPWRRRRRTIIASILVSVLVLAGAASTLLWLPALKVHDVSVAGTGYVDAASVSAAADPALGTSLALVDTGSIVAAVEEIPGVESAVVERSWPDGLAITVTERTARAVITRQDGSTAVVDGTGTELPSAAADGQTLVPLAVGADSQDPDGASAAMIAVVDGMPESLRGGITAMTASSRSDVSFTLALEGEEQKTVVWGDAEDAELKAKVVQALLDQPGTVIDVSSPVAPVTR